MTQRPAILIMQRHLAPLSVFLEGAYDVYRFWEGPPIEAAADVRVLVVAGEFELDKDLMEFAYSAAHVNLRTQLGLR